MTFQKRIKHFVLLIIYEILVGVVALILDGNILLYMSLSWGVPIIFFLYKIQIYRIKYVISGFFWSIPASIFIDFIGHYTRTWTYWDNPKFSLLGIEFFDMPIESFIWGFLFWTFNVTFYEYFFDKDRLTKIKNREKYFLLFFTIAAPLLIILIQIRQPNLYYYFLILLIFCIFTIIPCFIRYKNLRTKIFNYGIYIFTIGLLVEFFSLALDLWSFLPTEKTSIFLLNISNKIIPIEEILWWLILPMSIICFYEVFADNKG